MKPTVAFGALGGFEWDAGNAQKRWASHRVTPAESEEVFFNLPVFVLEDAKHSGRERRYSVVGRTNADRLLSVIFTLRGELVLRASGLDWTIVYPSGLTDGPRTDAYQVGVRLSLRGVPTVSRADVAHFLLEQVADASYLRQGVLISS